MNLRRVLLGAEDLQVVSGHVHGILVNAQTWLANGARAPCTEPNLIMGLNTPSYITYPWHFLNLQLLTRKKIKHH